MWIKFCGTTNIEDALVAVDAGASAIGFIFALSKRQVTPERAQEISRVLPPTVERIGVFVNESVDEVAKIVAHVGLTGVQLHGEESADYIELLHAKISPHTRIIKAMPYSPDMADRARYYGKILAVRGVLVDSAARGGTGIAFDWEHAKQDFESASAHTRLILAGGLDPENVARAISVLHPWGIDIASGVESAPGKKDHDKLRALVAEVRKTQGARI